MKNSIFLFISNKSPAIQLIIIVGFLFTIISYCTRKDSSEQQSRQYDYVEIQEEAFDPLGEPSLTRNFYFIFDGSGSMDGYIKSERKIDGAKLAVKEFMKHVPREVNLGLYVFDNYGEREVVSLGPNNHERFLEAIEKITPEGGTPLAAAIQFGTDQLKAQRAKQLGYGEFNLIVVTDGKANRIAEASKYAMRRGIGIHAIGLGIGRDHPLNNPEYVISYRAADDFDQLAEALVEAVAESEDFDITDFEK